MIDQDGISRRQALSKLFKGIAGSTMALPLYNLLLPSIAHSAPGDGPLRLICFFAPHGKIRPWWNPRPSSDATGFTLDFENSLLLALQRQDTGFLSRYGLSASKDFRDRLAVVDGLDNSSLAITLGGKQIPSGGHWNTPLCMMTGDGRVGNDVYTGNRAKHESIDGFIARSLYGENSTYSTPLVLGNHRNGEPLSFGQGGGNKRTHNHNPRSVFDSLFAGVESGNGGANDKKQSILDYIKNDLNRLETNLVGAERQKLQNHLQAIRNIERQLGSSGGCNVPNVDQFEVGNFNDTNNIPAINRAMFDLVAESFACDLKRFVTIFNGHSGFPYYPHLGYNGNFHDDISHSMQGHDFYESNSNIGFVEETYIKVLRWQTEQLCYLMHRLDSIPEGNGTVLDNTLIFYFSEMGHSAAHTAYDVPVILAGGAAGKLKMGQYFNAGTGIDLEQSNNKLLITLAHAFGIDIDSFGSRDWTGDFDSQLLA